MNEPLEEIVDSAFLSGEMWAEQEVIDYLRQKLREQLSSLDETEQLRYRNLLKQYADALKEVEWESNDVKETFDAFGVQLLKDRLLAATGKDIDPRYVYLHTRYLHIPRSLSKRETSSASLATDPPLPEPTSIRDVREPTYRVKSMSLWDAACLNFGLLSSFGSFKSGSLIGASYINDQRGQPFERVSGVEPARSDTLIDVKVFVDVVRELNVGHILKEHLAVAMLTESSLSKSLKRSVAAQLQFSLLELYRQSASEPAVREKVKALADALENKQESLTIHKVFMLVGFTNFDRLSGAGFNPQPGLVIAKAPGPETETNAHHIEIPLFQIERQGGAGFFSFFSGRPGGDLKFHATEKQLVSDFKEQFVTSYDKKDLEWFSSALTSHQLKKFSDTTGSDNPPQGLNVLAGWLYGAFKYLENKKPIKEIEFKTKGAGLTLEGALYKVSIEHFFSRLEHLAVEKSVRDITDIKEAVTVFFDELIGILLTPVPGSIKGLNRAVRYLMVGVTGHGLVRGIEQAAKGNGVELLQAMTDMLDVLVSVPLHTKLGKIVSRRHHKLLNDLGNPRKLTRPDGRPDLWYPDPARYAITSPGVIEGINANEQGIYSHNGHHYALIEKDSRTYTVEVERLSAGTHHRLVHSDASVHRPAVVFDSTRGRWRLQLDDSASLRDEQLLSRMVPGLPVSEAQTLLNISSVSRTTLDAVWAGEAAPAALIDAVTRFQADRLVEQITRPPSQEQSQIIALERPVLAALTQIDQWPDDLCLKVFDSGGNLTEAYSKPWHVFDFARSITLNRLMDGQLVLTATTVFKAFPVDTLTEILSLLPGPLLEATALSQALRLKIKKDKAAVFESLTIFKACSHSDRDFMSVLDKGYYPVIQNGFETLSGKTNKLRELHPRLSQERCLELVRKHPMLEHVHPDAIAPRALHNRVRQDMERTVFSNRLEHLLDAIYHDRPFNADADKWMRETCIVVVRRDLGITLTIIERASEVDNVRLTPNASDEAVLCAYGGGDYAAYDSSTHTLMPKETGGDRFFKALNHSLLSLDRVGRKHVSLMRAVFEWRKALGDELVRHRTQDGYLTLPQQKNEDYADSTIRWSASRRPSKVGGFNVDGHPYVVIEQRAYKVQDVVPGYKVTVVDPDMFARVPLLIYGNGEGAWRHGNETPLAWEGHQLYRRLGFRAVGFNPDQIDAISKVSGTTDEVLRRAHVDRARPPALLADTVQRFTSYRRLETLLDYRNTGTVQMLTNKIYDVFENFELRRLLESCSDEQISIFDRLYGTQGSPTPWRAQGGDIKNYAQLICYVLKKTTGGITPSLFELINHVPEHREAPSVALLKRVFPGLSANVADDLIRHATDAEALQMNTQGRVPLRLAQEARWYLRELRLNRAFEGFYWPALQNNDSVKLLLHAFGQQPGWPADCHIEVRESTATGSLIGQLGPEGASLQLVIVKTAGGWQVSETQGNSSTVSGHDLFGVVLEALPVAERAELGYTYKGGDALLKEQLTIKVTERRDLAYPILNMTPEQPWFKAPKRMADGRLGYELSGRGAVGRALPIDPSEDQYRALYPLRTAAQAKLDIRAMRERGLDVAAELTRLSADFEKLDKQLVAWIEAQKNLAPWNFQAVEDNVRIARRLINAWRKESAPVSDSEGRVLGYTLNLDRLRISSLPLLTVNFDHVRSLSMRDVAFGMDEDARDFLRNFGALTSLIMDRSGLRMYPSVINQMPNLNVLSLAHNVITLDADNLTDLSSQTQLQDLDLTGCRLLGELDVTRMTQLRRLNLSRTDAFDWPIGVEGLSHLVSLNLSHNLIFRVPVPVLHRADYQRINRVTNLSGNGFTAESLQRLQDYQRSTGINFGLPHEADQPVLAQHDSQIWLSGLSASDRESLQHKWDGLVVETGSEQFFELLNRLNTTAEFEHAKESVVRRVRLMLEAAARDAELRAALFNFAAHDISCSDSVAFIFSSLEIEVLVFEARTAQVPLEVERNLVNLRRGQFRLAQLDKLVARDAEQRRNLSQPVDDIELALSYRLALTDVLQLPGQPKYMKFPSLGEVGSSVIDAAKATILRMEGSDEMLAFMTQDSYWIEFLEARYAEKFAANTKQKAEIDFEALSIAGSRSYEDSNANFENWKRDRQAILVSLTRDALAKLDASQAAAPE